MRDAKGLKSQDILVLLKIISKNEESWRQLDLAYDLFMSQSEIAQSLARLKQSKLIWDKKPVMQSVFEFLVHGLKYVFPADIGAVSRGVPTSHSANPLAQKIISEKDDAYVWPDAEGHIRGHSIKPIYKSAPKAARRDKKLYELLALIDALRVGRPREVKLATEILKKELQS